MVYHGCMPHALRHFIHVPPKDDELDRLYISRTLRSVSVGMVGIFIPIYLISRGLGIDAVAVFMLVWEIVRYSVSGLTGRLMERFGAERVYAWSVLTSVFPIIGFAALDYGPWVLWITAVMLGISRALYWPSTHYIFTLHNNHKSTGRQASSLIILTRVGVALGPLIGGVIASWIGFEYVLISGVIVMAAAVLPFIFIRKPKADNPVYEPSAIKQYDIKPHLAGMFCHGYEGSSALFVWPLFMSLFLDSYRSIGIIVSLSFLIAIIVARLAGRFSDKGRSGSEIKVGSSGMAGVNSLRTTADSFLTVLGINVFNDTFSNVLIVPFMHNYYRAAEKFRLAYIIRLERASTLGNLTLWLLVLMMSRFLPLRTVLLATFLLAALAALGMGLINRPIKALDPKSRSSKQLLLGFLGRSGG